MRVSGNIATADLSGSSVSNIAVFFDQNLILTTGILKSPSIVASGTFTTYAVDSDEAKSGSTANV